MVMGQILLSIGEQIRIKKKSSEQEIIICLPISEDCTVSFIYNL